MNTQTEKMKHVCTIKKQLIFLHTTSKQHNSIFSLLTHMDNKKLLHLVRIDFRRTEYIDVLKSITEKLHRTPFSVGELCLEEQPANPVLKMI